MQNGKTAFRDWILYSNSKNALFCFYCLLFGGHKTSFEDQSRGFINWRNCYKNVGDHEKSSSHVKSIQTWYFRISNNGQSRIDNIVQKQITDSLSYWKNVLHRIVETLKFLTSRGLAIRGSNETLGSVHNGNYLGCLELIAKFDPFISQHLIKYGNKGRGNASYISSTICTEFIMVMGEAVIKEIVNQIQSRKYFSIIVDSTPDITKIDQLTIAIRYVMSDGFPIERFIGFLPSVGHKGEDMEKAIIIKFSELNINIENCRGQAYDNASNMSGIYNGLQSRIKRYAPTAEFIPCLAHSLNLVGSNAAESTSFDHLISDLNVRKMSYSTLNQNFGFFLNLEKEDNKTIRQCAENLIKLYPHDIEYHLVEEIIQFKVCWFSAEIDVNLYKAKMAQQDNADGPKLKAKEIIKQISEDLVNEDTTLPNFSETTLRRFLKHLNFEYVRKSRNSTLIERIDIVCWRRRYLESIKEYRQLGRPIYYLDKTWVNAGETTSKTWVDKTVNSPQDAFLRGLTTGQKEPSGVERVTPDIWKNFLGNIMKVEEKFWQVDFISNELLDAEEASHILTVTGDTTDSDSDSN
ncbi:hypothetical protein QTP88_010255 [Uroleucon formosanum]